MNLSKFNFNVIQIDSIESTNIYAQKLLGQEIVQEWTVLSTNYQENGKGQQGNGWESESGKNLLFSIILKPTLKIENQFLLSKVISIGLKNYLDSLSVGEVSIKWPNDVLVNGEKVAGILIENSVYGKSIKNSIVGIGLNVNQNKFQEYNRPATSLSRLAGKSFDLNEELYNVLKQIQTAYFNLIDSPDQLNKAYLKSLYGFGSSLKYNDQEGDFHGVILGVSPTGNLQLNRKGKLKSYDLKELNFLV